MSNRLKPLAAAWQALCFGASAAPPPSRLSRCRSRRYSPVSGERCVRNQQPPSPGICSRCFRFGALLPPTPCDLRPRYTHDFCRPLLLHWRAPFPPLLSRMFAAAFSPSPSLYATLPSRSRSATATPAREAPQSPPLRRARSLPPLIMGATATYPAEAVVASEPPPVAAAAASASRVLLLVGLPGSGKTTFALRLVEGGGWVRVSQDDVGGSRAAVERSFMEALESGHAVVVDRCNCTVQQRRWFIRTCIFRPRRGVWLACCFHVWVCGRGRCASRGGASSDRGIRWSKSRLDWYCT